MVLNQVNGPTLRQMDHDTRYDTLIDIWSEIKMLTGCILYENKALALQADILERFLRTHPGFMSLTKSEILHAFYLNSGGQLDNVYRHWNKELNAEFVGDVLGAYLRFKNRFFTNNHDLLAKAINPPAPKRPAPPTHDEWEADIQQDYQHYLAGNTELIFNTSAKYWYLRKCMIIEYSSRASWHRWYRYAFYWRRDNLQRRPAITEGARITRGKEMDMYNAILSSGVVPWIEHRSILHTMKRLVYLEIFRILKETAIVNIFSDIAYVRPKN